MSEPEFEEEETTPRFTKALIGRVLAVGLFVALGTFAVVQSMNRSTAKTDDTKIASTNENETENNPEGDDKNSTAKGAIASAATSLNNQFSSGNKSVVNPALKTTSNQTKTQFGSTSFPGTGTGNSVKPPGSKSFGASNPSIAQVAKPPIDRYAQANSGVPIIGSQGGFGKLKNDAIGAAKNGIDQLKTPTGNFGDSVNGSLKSAANSANNLKNQVTNKADNLLNNARNQGQKIVGKFNPAANPKIDPFPKQSGFGPDRNKVESKTIAGAKPPTSFGSTIPRNGFGQTNNPQAQTSRPVTGNFAAPKIETQKFGGNNTMDQSKAPAVTNNGFGPDSSSRMNATRQQITPKASLTPRITPPPSGSGFASSNLRPLQTKPSTTQQGFASPPATRSSFGDSGFGKSAAVNSRTQPPANSPRQNFPSNGTRPTIRQTTPARPASTNLPTRSTLGTGSSAGNAGMPVPRTKDIPGDRNLDGVQTPALTVEKLAPKEIQVNQIANFELVIKNVGRATAENVTVFDEIPAGCEFKGASPDQHDAGKAPTSNGISASFVQARKKESNFNSSQSDRVKSEAWPT